MRSHSRPRLNPAGQGPAKAKKDRLPALGVVVPLASRRRARDWKSTNNRLRDMGDLTILIDPAVLILGRDKGRGRAYPGSIIQLAAVVRAYSHMPLRQVEGRLREYLTGVGRPKELAPDYTTLSRRLAEIELPEFPRSSYDPGQPVVLVIDSTGVRISEAKGWHQDRNYAGDDRRVKYLKLHLGIDGLSGEICGYDITKSYGHGSGDNFVAPAIIDEAHSWAQYSGRAFSGGIGDGAYDSSKIYARCRQKGGPWLAPIPGNARPGAHPDRDRHILGVKRLGEVYHNRMGYHQRSIIEATNGALKRTLSLSSRARSFESQGMEIAWQLWVYATHIAKQPRVPVPQTG